MPIDTSIPLRAVSPRRNLLQDYAQGLQIKGAQAQIAAQEKATAKDAARTNALREAYDPTTGTIDYGKAEAALAGLGDIDSALALRKQASDEQALGIKARGEKMKAALAEVDARSRIVSGAKDQPTWEAALMRLQQMGVDVSGEPKQFDPAYVQSVIEQGLDVKSKLQMQMDERKFDATERYRDRTLKQGEERNAIARNRGEPLVEVFDESSPTGTRMVPRSQASGMPGKAPSNGITVTTDENGRPVVQVGGRGGLTNSTTTQVEKDTIEQGALLAELTNIESQLKPEYFTIGGRLKNTTRGVKAMINPELLSPQEQQQYSEFRDFKANTARTQAQVINKLYGAALSGGEAKRADQFLVTEGDDAITAQRKIKGYREFVTKAMAKNAYILKNGLDVNAVDVDAMPKIMRQRGDEIARELGGQLQGEELKAEVKRRLGAEFGLMQ